MKKIVTLVVVVGLLIFILIKSNHYFKKNSLGSVSTSQAAGVAQSDELLSSIEWLKRYPQLKNVSANSQTAVIDKLRVSESISELIGPIDNPYGVRNDILAAILEIVPESNPKMLKAAIKAAYYANLMFFSNDDFEKINFEKSWALASWCITYNDPIASVDYSLSYSQRLSDMFERRMYNTSSRNRYLTRIETTTFAWKPLGTGLGGSTEDERCQNEEY